MIDEALVAAYWRHYALATSDERADRLAASELFWAWEQVDQMAKAGAPGIVELLVALAATAPSDAALAYLGAGPVEECVRRNCPALRAEIEAASRQNESFAVALRHVWCG